MEKYGVDMNLLPVTHDQLVEIKKLAGEKYATIEMPRTRKEAEELIEKLASSTK